MQRIFPTQDYTGYEFKFCGVLGDPIVNPDFLDMVKYLTNLGGYCEVSTNGGYNTANWWSELGKYCSTTSWISAYTFLYRWTQRNKSYLSC